MPKCNKLITIIPAIFISFFALRIVYTAAARAHGAHAMEIEMEQILNSIDTRTQKTIVKINVYHHKVKHRQLKLRSRKTAHL